MTEKNDPNTTTTIRTDSAASTSSTTILAKEKAAANSNISRGIEEETDPSSSSTEDDTLDFGNDDDQDYEQLMSLIEGPGNDVPAKNKKTKKYKSKKKGNIDSKRRFSYSSILISLVLFITTIFVVVYIEHSSSDTNGQIHQKKKQPGNDDASFSWFADPMSEKGHDKILPSSGGSGTTTYITPSVPKEDSHPDELSPPNDMHASYPIDNQNSQQDEDEVEVEEKDGEEYADSDYNDSEEGDDYDDSSDNEDDEDSDNDEDNEEDEDDDGYDDEEYEDEAETDNDGDEVTSDDYYYANPTTQAKSPQSKETNPSSQTMNDPTTLPNDESSTNPSLPSVSDPTLSGDPQQPDASSTTSSSIDDNAVNTVSIDQTKPMKPDDGVYPDYSCPAEEYESPNEDYYMLARHRIRNETKFMERYHERYINPADDGSRITYDEYKKDMYDWKERRFAPYLESGYSIYESACGNGLNLVMTLEILQETHDITNLVVYGNDYVTDCVTSANRLLDMGIVSTATVQGHKGRICQGDSVNLKDFVPSNSFDLVFSGQIPPLQDPLDLDMDTTDALWRRYRNICRKKKKHQQDLVAELQQEQEKFFGHWVAEMVRIAKPGVPIIVEQVSPSVCTYWDDEGGVDRDFWYRAIDTYNWDVDISSLEIEDVTGQHSDSRYNVFMRKK